MKATENKSFTFWHKDGDNSKPGTKTQTGEESYMGDSPGGGNLGRTKTILAKDIWALIGRNSLPGRSGGKRIFIIEYIADRSG